MAGLPKLPGYNFQDFTKTRYHKSHTFDFNNGYDVKKLGMPASGGDELDVNSVALVEQYDTVEYDPTLTYGSCREKALPQFVPHWVLYDQKCLTFKAFFKQSVSESPLEYYRVRQVNIIYFLEDDTITVMEPRIVNSGLDQGRIIRRGKIPRTENSTWHWKDFDIGKDVTFNGIVFHIVDGDMFTKEYMRSQGIILSDSEEMPPDPYTQQRTFQQQVHSTKTPAADDKLRRFLEYDGKILRFDAIWDTRDEEFGEIRNYIVFYFLADDTVSVKEFYPPNSGRDPFPLLLRKIKLPKIYTDQPETFPMVYFESSDAEVTEYYQPKDFLVGETIFVLGRPMLLTDCDSFTRNYYRKVYRIEQKPRIETKKKSPPQAPKPMPPHDGLGSLEDSLQSTRSFVPTPPRKDTLRQILNANKYLRYELVMDSVHPEDSIRRFLLKYSLSNGTCMIYEPPIRNSGILGGRYLKDMELVKPGSDPLNPEYYTPVDFYIGAIIYVFRQRFKIVGADLYVYRYMQANSSKFPCHVIENMRNYMFNKGYLDEDIENRISEEARIQKKAERDAIGKEIEIKKSELDKCMQELKVGAQENPEYAEAKRKEILQQYEDSLKHTFVVPPHGIQEVNTDCKYPIIGGRGEKVECPEGKEEESGVPKRIETPEEKQAKFYKDVFAKQENMCNVNKDFLLEQYNIDGCKERLPTPILVSGPPIAKAACKSKNVTFDVGDDPCKAADKDFCGYDKEPCNCTYYDKC